MLKLTNIKHPSNNFSNLIKYLSSELSQSESTILFLFFTASLCFLSVSGNNFSQVDISLSSSVLESKKKSVVYNRKRILFLNWIYCKLKLKTKYCKTNCVLNWMLKGSNLPSSSLIFWMFSLALLIFFFSIFSLIFLPLFFLKFYDKGVFHQEFVFHFFEIENSHALWSGTHP